MADKHTIKTRTDTSAVPMLYLEQFLFGFKIIGVVLTLVSFAKLCVEWAPPEPSDGRAHGAYSIIATVLGIATLSVAALLGSQYWPGSSPRFDASPIREKAKKIGIMTADSLYLLTAVVLTVWEGGARQSQCANLVLMSASLSAFAARFPKSRWGFAIVTTIAYVLAYLFAAPRGKPIAIEWVPRIAIQFGWHSNWTSVCDLVIVGVVLWASAYTGGRVQDLLTRAKGGPMAPSGAEPERSASAAPDAD